MRTPAERKAAALAALKTGRNLLIGRGWAPGDPWVPALGPNLGAQGAGPVSAVSALADAPGLVFWDAFRALKRVAGVASLVVHERSGEQVLSWFNAAIAALEEK